MEHYNSRYTSYQCSMCQSFFDTKTRLKNHMGRRTPCGVIQGDDLIDEIRFEFANVINKWNSIEKTIENKDELNILMGHIRTKYNAIIRYSKIEDEEKDAAFKQINSMKEILNNII